ncbi:hypothetical protein GOEFS_096_01070 [Gordonia effusa NBRC 100432]|uniref:Serine aminopeptidase S33 domain-containing protein n=1 Tax=Gordonia effusa NBRC 100432 TaxID=1077974 RepID=H0R4C9_9ACTN|nr:alpha/beta fold hydrolase [Gordonia effusa]GAB19930.1 hypothetical protein GOEFS_096_01070 [Gordonia effusa NBRC 100432]
MLTDNTPSSASQNRYTRDDVTFDSHGSQCAAWLYTPVSTDGRPRPVIVMAHGLGAVREFRLHEFAERFVASGYSVLVFDYRHFGASGGHPRQLVDISRQLQDWLSALRHVRAHPEQFDLERIAIWGSSFGGGHVMQVAAIDGNVRAVISQCPFTDGPSSLVARIRTGFLSAPVLVAAALIDQVGALLGRSPLLLPMVGTPNMPAFLAASDALPGALALAPSDARPSARTLRNAKRIPSVAKHMPPLTSEEQVLTQTPERSETVWGVLENADGTVLMRNAIAARLALHIGRYRPGKALSSTTIPTLVCVGTHDSVAPAKATINHAKGLAHVTQRSYPTGHFDIYVGAWFERVATDQVAFLAQHMPAH